MKKLISLLLIFTLSVAVAPTSLAAREIRLMELFMNNPDIYFSTEDLLERVLHEEDADSDAVWMYISFLRNKLKAVGATLAIVGEEGGSYSLKKAAVI